VTNVLVRNIPEDILARLKEKAARQNRSLQQELRGIIVEAAHDEVGELVDRIRERRVRYEASGKSFEDSSRLIRRDRSR